MFTTPFYPAAHYSPAAEFNGLFRLLDNAVNDLLPSQSSSRQQSVRHFTPRFDVKEIGSSYELQGELPGIQQKDLEIEFTDERTLVIRGKAVRETSESNVDAAKAVEGSIETKAVEGAEPTTVEDDATSQRSGHSGNSSLNYRKASVEDEYVDAGAEVQGEKTADAAAENQDKTQVAAPNESKPAEPSYKYWVSERSVGQFERRFAFPGRVDQEAVTASLKNGILSVVVPKIVEKAARKIQVS